MIFRIVRVQFLLWLAFPLLLIGQTNPPGTNVEIFQRLAGEIVQEVAEDAGVDSSHRVIFKSRSENKSGDWLIENAFIRYFLSQNIPVQMADQESEENSFLFEFFLTELTVKYKKISSKSLSRHFVVKADARVSRGKAKSIVINKNYSRAFQDTISYNTVERVESAHYPFTHAELPRGLNLKKWISPAVILVSTGVVIYSFFALRSK